MIKQKSGFTLLELLMASAFGIVFSAMLALFFSKWNILFRRNMSMVDLRSITSVSAEQISRELEKAYQNKQGSPNPPISYFNTPVTVSIATEQGTALIPPGNVSSDYDCPDQTKTPNYCGTVVSFVSGNSTNVPNAPDKSSQIKVTYGLADLGTNGKGQKVFGIMRTEVNTPANGGSTTTQRLVVGFYRAVTDYVSVRAWKIKIYCNGSEPASQNPDNRSCSLNFQLQLESGDGRIFPEKGTAEFSGTPTVSPPPDSL